MCNSVIEVELGEGRRRSLRGKEENWERERGERRKVAYSV